MRQVCNVAFAQQLEGMFEPAERETFLRELYQPPGRMARVSYVTPELDALMAPPSMRGGR